MIRFYFADPVPHPGSACPGLPSSGGIGNIISRYTGANLSFAEHDGPLSIKCCFGGQEIYDVGGSRHIVDESGYLVLNQGQRYASAFRAYRGGESFCAWFRPGFAQQVWQGMSAPAEQLLDEPALVPDRPVRFFERLYSHDDQVTPLLFRIRRAIDAGEATRPWLEEQFHLLLERLLQSQHNLYQEARRLPALRPATRLEMYQRLAIARDYLDSHLHERVSILEAASVACLSPHHFLRQFTLLFGETPYQYHRRKRLERAGHLLTTTEQSVTTLCFELGFESLGYFSGLFRQHFGYSPTAYRLQFARQRAVRLLAQQERPPVSPDR